MEQNKNKLSIHWKILIGLILGLLIGFFASNSDIGAHIVQNFIKPIGTIFIKILKLIAVPLVFISLAKGIVDLKDIKKLSAMGGKTIMWYLNDDSLCRYPWIIFGQCIQTWFRAEP